MKKFNTFKIVQLILLIILTAVSLYMLMQPEVSFFDLFEPDYSKTEIITTFQALLELLKLQVVRATQTEVFGDIVIHRAEIKDGD